MNRRCVLNRYRYTFYDSRTITFVKHTMNVSRKNPNNSEVMVSIFLPPYRNEIISVNKPYLISK